ncbi:hypothetical protein MYAER_2729 [Microcystis aeruginosa NIES-2549]|uniref:Uncharacterized protein n=1 Tax=Microcystis aeruginosa NIES-2549 TaxID=1641812 RepID=A0A0F6U5W1_MICAE|nr:hypothetical protein MYAER_2729 [Microcystis aeruginosa NIES-2549]AOC53470.1 hypothetical protein amyaer_2761 [Microcystis aeruginosa NIES-2481]
MISVLIRQVLKILRFLPYQGGISTPLLRGTGEIKGKIYLLFN